MYILFVSYEMQLLTVFFMQFCILYNKLAPPLLREDYSLWYSAFFLWCTSTLLSVLHIIINLFHAKDFLLLGVQVLFMNYGVDA